MRIESEKRKCNVMISGVSEEKVKIPDGEMLEDDLSKVSYLQCATKSCHPIFSQISGIGRKKVDRYDLYSFVFNS